MIPYTNRFPEPQVEAMFKNWQELQKRDKKTNNGKLYILTTLKNHLDEHQIPFFLMYGTLLGAVRDQDFISWDGDVDIAILGRDQDRLFDSFHKMPSLNLIRVGHFYCSFAYQDEYADIYTFTEEQDRYSYCGGEKPYFDEAKDVFDNPSTIKFKNMEFLTVKNPEASLTRWYGDWRTPSIFVPDHS